MAKGRKGRQKLEQEEKEVPVEEEEPPPSFKDLDFAQRRAWQRQQAADKRRSKQKCYLCGRAGHVRRECPGILDDGRGMSHYKGKSDKAAEKQKLMDRRKKRNSSGNHESSISELWPDYPEDFCVMPTSKSELATAEEPLSYYDVYCDVGASLAYLRQGRGKTKLSHKAAMAELRAALFMSNGLKAMLSRTAISKPDRPWTNPHFSDLSNGGEEDECPVKVYYALELTESFVDDKEAAENQSIENLLTIARNNTDCIVAIGAILDYRHETTGAPGMDVTSQIFRLKVAWQAAGRLRLPIQLRILPGASSLDPKKSIADTPYARVLLDTQEQLASAVAAFPDLRIHLVSWCGKSCHMTAILQAFPNNIQALGLDGTVTFAKATELHECAFDVPLDKLVIETASTIPSQVNSQLGRGAFFHSGWWPFVAQAVADHRKVVSLRQVVQAANENALRLYPQLGLGHKRGNESD